MGTRNKKIDAARLGIITIGLFMLGPFMLQATAWGKSLQVTDSQRKAEKQCESTIRSAHQAMDMLEKRLYHAQLKAAQEIQRHKTAATNQIEQIHKRLAKAIHEQERRNQLVRKNVGELHSQLEKHLYTLYKKKKHLEQTTRENKEVIKELDFFCEDCMRIVAIMEANENLQELPKQFKDRVSKLKEKMKRFQQTTQKNQEAIKELDIARENCMRFVATMRKKNTTDRSADKCPRVKLDVLVHLENIGDRQGHDNEFLGTRGESRRLEGFSININPPVPHLGIRYMAHLADIGDVPYQQNGEFIGTRSESHRLEGFAIELTGRAVKKYDVLYMAHLQNKGDTPWYKNGQFCGTRGQSRRVEGISVRVVPRKKAQPGNNTKNLVSYFSSDKKGLVLHYSFDKDEGAKVIDLSGQGNHGHVHGARWTPKGHVGGAYSFDGQAHIDVQNPRFLDGCKDVTICAWFNCKLPSRQGGQIIASGDPRGGNDPISTRINTSTFEDFGFRDMLGNQDIKSPWGGGDLGIHPKTWQMLAITLKSKPNASVYTVYLDGKVIDRREHPKQFTISYDRDMPTQLGAIHGIQGWIGMLDEIKVFQHALSENEIRQMHKKNGQ